MPADASIRDGPTTVGAAQVTSGTRSQVIFMPATDDWAVATAGLPPVVKGIVGVPLDVDVLLPYGSSMNVVFTLFYTQEIVDATTDTGAYLYEPVLLRLTANGWTEVLPSEYSRELHWIAARIPLDGIYAIGIKDAS